MDMLAGPLMVIGFLTTLAMPIVVGVYVYRLLNSKEKGK